MDTGGEGKDDEEEVEEEDPVGIGSKLLKLPLSVKSIVITFDGVSFGNIVSRKSNRKLEINYRVLFSKIYQKYTILSNICSKDDV
jgi:hypothetical protein